MVKKSPTLLGKETLIEQQKDCEQKEEGNSSHHEGEYLQKNELNNGHTSEKKSDKTANQHHYSDNLNKSRFLLLAVITYAHMGFVDSFWCLTVSCISSEPLTL